MLNAALRRTSLEHLLGHMQFPFYIAPVRMGLLALNGSCELYSSIDIPII